ncbi:MAG: phenylalanine--tRNA ligase subunit alpha [Planctomycetota bacterium]
MTQAINDLQARALSDLQQVQDPDALEAFRIQYLGAKGELKALMGQMGQVPPAEKPAFGKAANALKQQVQKTFDARKAELATDKPAATRVDVTEPGLPPRLGRRHVVGQVIDEILDAFGRLGFTPVEGPEAEDEHHNFVALNIPAEHPARDPLDNFYLTDPTAANPSLLRSQTSTVQIRVMESTPPPVRVVSVGRVYRPDEHDATHFSMFHQVEGLYVDKHVTMADLKGTLVGFAKTLFGPDADVKLVPSYFPFTEPSAELYVKMDLGKGMEWVEVGGCGMVDPAVFEAVGYDPEAWTGFAFGLGIERLAMRRYNIPDIRLLFQNDVRFLKQF